MTEVSPQTHHTESLNTANNFAPNHPRDGSPELPPCNQLYDRCRHNYMIGDCTEALRTYSMEFLAERYQLRNQEALSPQVCSRMHLQPGAVLIKVETDRFFDGGAYC